MDPTYMLAGEILSANSRNEVAGDASKAHDLRGTLRFSALPPFLKFLDTLKN